MAVNRTMTIAVVLVAIVSGIAGYAVFKPDHPSARSSGSASGTDGRNSSSASSSGATPAASTPASMPVPSTGRPVMIYTAYCYLPGSAVDITVVGVDGWDPKTGALQFHHEFDLPGNVDVTGHAIHPDGTQTQALTDLAYLCAPVNNTDAPDGTGIYEQAGVPWLELRNLFNDDFSKIAVVVADTGDSGTSVGFVDSAGKLTSLPRTGEADGSAVEDDAKFAPDGHSIWFGYPGGIGSRDLADGHTLANHAGPKTDDAHLPFVVAGAPAAAVYTTGNVVTRPAGDEVAVSYNDKVLIGPAADFSTFASTGQALKVVPSCGVTLYGWVGDHQLLCAVADSVTSPPYVSVVDTGTGTVVRKLLPESNATQFLNIPQAVSPDGSEFANVAITSEGPKLEIDSTTSTTTTRELSFTADQTSQTPSMTAILSWQ